MVCIHILEMEIQGTIIKPTGKKDESIDVHGEYQVEWKSINNWKYYIVDM